MVKLLDCSSSFKTDLKLITLLILILLTLAFCGTTQADAPGQPYASYWHPNDLLTWSPETDPDAPFNRGNTPLADRFIGSIQVNTHARPNEAKIAALSIMYPSTSDNPSQGNQQLDVYAFNYWQYIDILVMWGGSAGEGLILAPNPDVIDAGHRNGVKVYGTIFLPPTQYGGEIQWVYDLVQTSGATYPVADKLIEVAAYYGFDGWFINQETAGGDAALATEMRNFMEYIQSTSDVGIMWYDSMVEAGNIAWQNALNDSNDMFFEDGTTISDEMFLNFWWNVNRLTNSANHAATLGRSPYDLYAGIDVQSNGLNTNVNWDALFPEDEPHRTSLGIYCPNWSFSSSNNQNKFYQKANRFWIGPNRDPSNTITTNAWKGLAHYVPAFSVINDLPFVTHFNTGQGHLYAVDGALLATRDWNNRSLQDILPTWRWISECDGNPLYPELDWTDAYYGGTCLKVSGDIAAGTPTHLKLFKTDLPVSIDTELEVVYRTTTSSGPTHLSAGVSFTDNPHQFYFFPLGDSSSSDWSDVRLDLSAYSGKTIAILSLQFHADEAVSDYSIKIGRLGVFDGSPDTIAPPTNIIGDTIQLIDAQTGTLRLYWDHSPDDIRAYNVYLRHSDTTRIFLGGTPNNAYFIQEISRTGSEDSVVIEVEAVGPGFTHSSASSAEFSWPEMSTPTPTPTARLTGVTIQIPGDTFHPGDSFWCSALVYNDSSTALTNTPLFVILDVFGDLFFAPSFSSSFDIYPAPWDSGETTVSVLEPFSWPTTGSTADGIYWYAALTNQDMTEIFGSWDMRSFGWQE